MMKTYKHLSVRAAVAALMVLSAGAAAAEAQSAPPAEALSWMVGEWQGSGWTLSRSGERRTFTVEESVRSAASGHALLIHGVGESGGMVVHDAGGFVTRDGEGYVMRAVSMQGHRQDVALTVTEDGFAWTLSMGPAGEVRYQAVHADGVWHETGAWCPADAACRQTFEMSLERRSY